MESELRQDIAALQVAIDQVKDVRAMFEPLDRPAEQKQVQKLEVNMGGSGVWIACAACLAMLVMNICLLALFINHDRKIDTLDDYVKATYMMQGKKP